MSDLTVSSPTDTPVSQAIDEFVATLPPLPRSLGGLAPEGAGAPPQEDSPAQAQVAQVKGKPSEGKPDPSGDKPAQDEKFSRGFARLAAREQALVVREQAVETKIQESQKAAQETLVARFRSNPIRALKEMGLTTEQISTMGRAALGATLENAPPQYRELADKLRLDEQNEDVRSELKSLREEIAKEKAEKSRSESLQAHRQAYETDLQKHVTDPGLSEQAPSVARLFAANPEKTMRRIYDLVAQDAKAKIRSGAHVGPMSPSEAIAALEEDLGIYAKTFGSGGPSQTTQTVRDKDAPARKTLSDSSVNPAPTTRSAPDPEKDWEGWKRAQEEAFLAELSRRP